MRKPALLFCLLLALPFRAAAQDPDIARDERTAIDDWFRTSELDGEKPVGRRGQTKRVSVPRGARRTGCRCMDDTESPAHSIGACSGHGGVRYWLYCTREGDTVRVLTARHEAHPHPLDSIERSALARPAGPAQRRGASANPAQPTVIVVQAPPAQPPTGSQEGTDWPEAIGLSAGGALTLFGVRLLLGWANQQVPFIRHALRHLLRHRKRPPARKNGKGARPPRL